jgi:hypothetical protein
VEKSGGCYLRPLPPQTLQLTWPVPRQAVQISFFLFFWTSALLFLEIFPVPAHTWQSFFPNPPQA